METITHPKGVFFG